MVMIRPSLSSVMEVGGSSFSSKDRDQPLPIGRGGHCILTHRYPLQAKALAGASRSPLSSSSRRNRVSEKPCISIDVM